MKGYGAVEMGVHRFHHPGHEETEGVGEGKSIHLWQCKDGAWKITRVISYDHHAAPKQARVLEIVCFFLALGNRGRETGVGRDIGGALNRGGGFLRKRERSV
jgi:hypothetical protein